MPDYANLLFKVVAIFGVINRVPATALAHNVFCYSAVAHILTPSVNLACRPKPDFKNKCRARAGFGLRPGSGFKMRHFSNSVWVYMQGQQGEMERIHPPLTKSKNRLKSFCEAGYASFRSNVFAAGKRISVEIW